VRAWRALALTAASFRDAPAAVVDALTAASPVPFYGTVRVADLETITVNTVVFAMDVAALDTTNDGVQNYDTIVFFDETNGIEPGPFALPSTGPAYVRAADERSRPFFYEGTANRVGTAFYVSHLDPELNVVRIARYSANFIPRNAPVIADVDDMNTNVGFWAPQPDFRIPERLSPGFGVFSDAELEAIYQDQVDTFTDYQTRMATHAIETNPDADLVMLYFEQPPADGSGQPKQHLGWARSGEDRALTPIGLRDSNGCGRGGSGSGWLAVSVVVTGAGAAFGRRRRARTGTRK
jgi:hypothetical protein